jgi:hypothetical protein
MSIVKQLLYTCVSSDCPPAEKERLYKEAIGLAKRWRTPGVKGEQRVSLDALLDSTWMPFLCRERGDEQLALVVKALRAHLAHNNVHPSLLGILDARFAVDTPDGFLMDTFISICVPAIRSLIVALVKCGVEALRAALTRFSSTLATSGSSKSGKNQKRKRHDMTDEGAAASPTAEPASASATVENEVVSSA